MYHDDITKKLFVRRLQNKDVYLEEVHVKNRGRRGRNNYYKQLDKLGLITRSERRKVIAKETYKS